MNSIADHLWQSTVFAGVVWVLTLALRKNPARVRHGLWLAASCKFLIPFSVLIALGDQIHWRKAEPMAQSNIAVVVDQVSQPFTAPAVVATIPPTASPVPAILFGIWACGFVGIACTWWIRWRRIRAAVRAGSPVSLDIPIPAMSSPTLLEPGVFGIIRPILLLPDGILDHLTPAQLKAVIAHELCHVRHRDNLIAAMHMFVETVFWFHPLVWWIGKRMVEEREHACDEEVLQEIGEPKAYAEGILNVCKQYVESPLTCVSGVTGANLKKRIETIMTNRIALRLNFAKKAALAATGAVAFAMPVFLGMMHAQSPATPTPKFEVATIKLSKDCSAGPLSAGRPPAGRLSEKCISLASFIKAAYIWFENGRQNALRSAPLEGGPAWIDSDLYEIDAKAEGNPPQEVMRGPMMQALLEDRLKLKIHREIREVPVYDLTVAKSGPKLKTFLEGSCTPLDLTNVLQGSVRPCIAGLGSGGTSGSLKLEARGMGLDEFSKFLGLNLDRPVIDKTGIAGTFDFSVEFAPDQATPRFAGRANPDGSSGTSIFTAMQEQLGLKLEKARGPGVFLVIDHVERPAEN